MNGGEYSRQQSFLIRYLQEDAMRHFWQYS